MSKMTHVGGRMYGDGAYSVEFKNVGSTLTPMGAYVVGPDIDGVAEVKFGLGASKPTCGLAAEAVDVVKKALAKEEE